MDDLNQYWQLLGLSNMSREGVKGFLAKMLKGYIYVVELQVKILNIGRFFLHL